jgi:hypothetical protein
MVRLLMRVRSLICPSLIPIASRFNHSISCAVSAASTGWSRSSEISPLIPRAVQEAQKRYAFRIVTVE